MNRTLKQSLWLLLALTVESIALILSHRLHLPESLAIPLTMSLWMLVIFPFMKRWMPGVTFAQWVVAVLVGAISIWLIFLVFARLGLE